MNNTTIDNNFEGNVETLPQELISILSDFIKDKGMAEEFVAYAVTKQTNAKLLDVEALAKQSFTSLAFEGEAGQEQQTAQQKTADLYTFIKSIVLLEAKESLFDFNEAYGEYAYIVAKDAYITGFKNALSVSKEVAICKC